MARIAAAALLLTMLPTSAFAAQQVPADVNYATNTKRIVQAVKPVQSGAKNIDLQVTASGDGDVITVLMKTTDYAKITSLSTITLGNYDNIPVLSSVKYWYSKSHFSAAGTATLDLTATKGTDHNLEAPGVTESSNTYHQSYTFLVFDNVAGTQTDADYTVGTFRVDSEGFLQRDSYMVRYMKNGASAGGTSTTPGNMPGYQITDWDTATSLRDNVPTRTGYTFLGWDKDGALLGTDPNAAAASTKTPAYLKGGSYPAPIGTHNPAADAIESIFAIWKPIKADFAEETKTLTGAQVGKSFDSGKILLNSTSSPDTVKEYTVVNGTLPAGLSVQSDGNEGWKITGTPTTHSGGLPVVVTIQVKDKSNNTTDTLELTFDKVEKGEQFKPDLDVNTGLTAQMVDDSDESTLDGRLIGFYSLGQETQKDAAGAAMTDGTGTYSNYYKTKGMIYEYRPIKVGGVDLTYTPEQEVASWREIPATKDMYGAAPAGWELFEASLAQGAATRYKTTVVNKLATFQAQAEGTAWNDAYGAILFEGNLPVVTGLDKDDMYQIRFRANDTYMASEPAVITIGGATASGGQSGYSVLFNLMGGKVFKVTTTPPDTEGGEPVVTEVDVTDQLFGQPLTGLKAGDTVNLPTLALAANERLEFRKEGSTFAGFYDGTTTYTPEGTWSFTMPAYSVGLAAMWGVAGEIDPNAVAAVTLFDWDNSYLGSVTVVKGATNEQVMATINDYCTSNATIAAALAGKDGYVFTHWVDNDYTGLLAWGEKAKVSSSAGGILENIEEPPHISFEALSKNMTVKAAYEAAGVADITSVALRNYSFGTEVNYNKMGTSNYYSITVTVNRRNSAGDGVQRMATPAVRVQMTTSAGTMYQLVYLDETDTATATFAVNAANTTTVLCGAIDTYGITAWSSSAAARGTVTLRAGTPNSPGFIYYGSLTFVNEQVAPGGTISQVTLPVLQDNLGLDLSSVLNNATTARTHIQTAWNTKGSDLTAAEMQYAIEHNGAWQGG